MPSPDSNISEEEVELKRAITRDKRWLGLGVVGFVVVVLMVGGAGWGYRNSQISNSQTPNKETEIIAETPKESQKPVEQVQQSYSIEILNGSGVTGAASSAKAELESRFKNQDVSLEITTGNGEAQTGTIIQYKIDSLRRGRLAVIVSELYPAAKTSVDGAIVADVRLILGK